MRIQKLFGMPLMTGFDIEMIRLNGAPVHAFCHIDVIAES